MANAGTNYSTKMIEPVTAEIVSAVSALPYHDAANMRRVRKQFSDQLRDFPPKFLHKLAIRLLREGQFVYRFIGHEMIFKRRDALAALGEKEVVALAKGISSWYDTDTFGGYISGPAWIGRQIPDDLVVGWAKSPDFWLRRTALTTTVPLNQRSKGGMGDTKRTLKICRMLIDDHEDMVVKAMSWALRSVVWHDREAIEAFIVKYEDRLAARVKREVRHKIRTGVKNPRRK